MLICSERAPIFFLFPTYLLDLSMYNSENSGLCQEWRLNVIDFFKLGTLSHSQNYLVCAVK